MGSPDGVGEGSLSESEPVDLADAPSTRAERREAKAKLKGPPGILSDLRTLSKPGITSFCVMMAAGGAGVAGALPGVVEGPFPWLKTLVAMVGCGMSVAGANTLNMFAEREGDKSMRRTKERPLPAGRMKAWVALVFGIVLAVISTALLWWVNSLTAYVALAALLSYVFIYTPMKRRSALALWVGAFPGAAPPLLGWTAVTGEIGAPGVVLFAILWVWQIPHFIAISIFRQRDYEQAGIYVVPSVSGLESAKVQSLVWSIILVTTSMMLVVLNVANMLYFTVASLVGVWFFVFSMRGFEPDAGNKWARSFFFASLIYLPVLTLALVLDLWWLA
ncbi:MAG: protoheme IX farnesyltransferase [Bradymonadia bacterium]|jgi:protoheme IX farnesyltransferase